MIMSERTPKGCDVQDPDLGASLFRQFTKPADISGTLASVLTSSQNLSLLYPKRQVAAVGVPNSSIAHAVGIGN